MTEHLHRDEADAHAARRRLIAAGRPVSLIAYDGERDRYVFDSH